MNKWYIENGAGGDVVVPAMYGANDYQPHSIGDDAFGGRTEVRRVTLPETITYIGNRAFNRCTGIEVFEMPPTVLHLGKNVFAGWTKNQKIIISRAQVKIFKKSNKITRGKWNGNTKAKIIVR